jgi:hypothetical protein
MFFALVCLSGDYQTGLTMGINGLEVNYKLGREVAAKMSVVGFEAPVLNQQTRNKRDEEDAGADDM